MGDEERRELERRIRQGADPADEARWLTERVRRGALPAARLELAAYLGHAPAKVALGAAPPAADDDAVRRWGAALDDAGRAALVRAAIAALRVRFSDVPSPRAHLVEGLGLLEAWLKDPTDERAASAMGYEPRFAQLHEAFTADQRLESAGFARRAQDATRALLAVVNRLTWGYDPFEACLRDLRDVGKAAAPLVAWALAAGDPGLSDAALRELERAWRSSRDPQDEARLLAERLRGGLLTRPRLELAAYVGHGPARVALGDAAPAGRRVPWPAWVAAIDDDGRATLVRALVDGVASAPGLRAEASLDAALDGLLEWLACPCPTHASALRALRDALRIDPPLPEALASAALERTIGALCLREAILLVLTPGADAIEGALRRVLDVARAKDPPLRTAGLVAPLLAWALGPEHTFVRSAGGEQAAAYLRARLARGELTRERVALAAYADDPDACAALGADAPDAPGELAPWIAGLAGFDPALRVRAVAALAGHELMTPVTRAWLGAPLTTRAYAVRAMIVGRAREACDALRRFAEDPGAVGALVVHAERLADASLDRAAPDDRAAHGVLALRAALDCALGGTAVDVALAAVLRALPGSAHGDALLVVRGVVAAWALGA